MAWFSRVWVPLAIAVTGICALTFLAVQQSYRMNLNDPQIEIAENAADGLLKGAVPASFVERGVPPIDIALSLSPWIAIYDASGTALESNAILSGAPPKVPLSALQAARD